jgi:hypothetical protein
MVRNKIYMKLIMSMSLCDFLGSVVDAYGFYGISHDACAAQGMCWYLFLYTAWMAVLLFTHVTFAKVYLSFTAITAITAVVSVVMFVLPLIFMPIRYGGEECQYEPGGLTLPTNEVWTEQVTLELCDWINAM